VNKIPISTVYLHCWEHPDRFTKALCNPFLG